MESQDVRSKELAPGITFLSLASLMVMIAIVVAFQFSATSDPYIQKVLALKGYTENGHAIFEINCAGCHGWEADGNVGPSLHQVSRRKSKVGLINQVISGKTPPMPKFQPKAQEMADLLGYLEQL